MLQISQGLDTFYYGSKDDLQAFSKKEIVNVVVRQALARRDNNGGISTIIIRFRNGSELILSSVMLAVPALLEKLHEPPVVYENVWFYAI
jgi:hypothetical protein